MYVLLACSCCALYVSAMSTLYSATKTTPKPKVLNHQILDRPTLGETMQLGGLYDINSDAYIPGLSFHTKKYIDAVSKKSDAELYSKPFQVVSNENWEMKLDHIESSPEMKASILGGLRKLSGASSFAEKSTYMPNILTQTITATKYFYDREIPIDYLIKTNGSHNADIIELLRRINGVSHVIQKVRYGLRIYLSLELEVPDEPDAKLQANADLKQYALLLKDGNIKITNESSFNVKKIDFDETETVEDFEKYSCVYNGDVFIENIPTSFLDAVNVSLWLRDILYATNPPEPVPLKVWLYPIHLIFKNMRTASSSVDKLLVKRVFYLVNQLQETIGDLKRIQSMYQKTLLPSMNAIIDDLHRKFFYKSENLEINMGRMIQGIRNGENTNEDLDTLYQQVQDEELSDVSALLVDFEKCANMIHQIFNDLFIVYQDESHLIKEIISHPLVVILKIKPLTDNSLRSAGEDFEKVSKKEQLIPKKYSNNLQSCHKESRLINRFWKKIISAWSVNHHIIALEDPLLLNIPNQTVKQSIFVDMYYGGRNLFPQKRYPDGLVLSSKFPAPLKKISEHSYRGDMLIIQKIKCFNSTHDFMGIYEKTASNKTVKNTPYWTLIIGPLNKKRIERYSILLINDQQKKKFNWALARIGRNNIRKLSTSGRNIIFISIDHVTVNNNVIDPMPWEAKFALKGNSQKLDDLCGMLVNKIS